MEKKTFFHWLGEFFEPYKSSIRVQMMLTMIFSFYIIWEQVTNGSVDHSLVVMLLVGAFAPKLIEKFTPKK